MEPAQATMRWPTVQIRRVPEARIKTLYSVIKLPTEDLEQVKAVLAQQMAEELIAKLFEFKKVEKTAEFEGVFWYRVALDVIVPETPKNHI